MDISRVTARFKPGGIGRHISWLMLQSMFEAATMTVATLLAAKWFGPVAWGQLAIVLTGVQLISMIADGFYGAVLKFVSDASARQDPASARIGWHFGWLSILVLFFLSALLGISSFAGYSSDLLPVWIVLAVILATARGWRAVFDGGFRGHQQFRAPAIAGIVCSATMAGAIIALSAVGYRVTAYLAVMAAGTLLNSAWLAMVYRNQILQGRSQVESGHAPDSNDFVRYAMPLAFRGLAAFLFIKVNVWILGDLATKYDTGQFRLADQFITIPTLVLSAVLAAITPRLAQAQLEGHAHLSMMLSKVYGFMLVLTLPLAIFFWWNGPLITWLFPEYGPASEMLRYFAPAMVVQGVGYAASVLLVQGGHPGAAFFLTLFPGIANVAAAYFGFKWNGVFGLTLGTAVVHFITYTATIIVAHRLLRLPFRIRFS